MDPTVAAVAPPPPHANRWPRFALRGVRVTGAAFVIATCLWALMRQPFGTTIVYSLCISLSTWLIIDLSRMTVASRSTGWFGKPASGDGKWPGWTWMLFIVVIGAMLGYTLGNEIGNRITGLNLPGPFNASVRETFALLVTKEGKTYLNGVELNDDGIVQAVREAKGKGEDVQAVVGADKNATHGAVTHLLDLLKGAGVTKFAIQIEKQQ